MALTQPPQRKTVTRGARNKHLARRDSPDSWLGDFVPLDFDEAIIFGPVFRQDLTSYGEHVIHALYGSVERSKCELLLRNGRCTLVRVHVTDTFFRRKALVFDFPPMRASEVVRRIWTAITTARQTPNVDPVALARESLSHGPIEEDPNPDSDSFSLVPAAWAEE